MSIQSLERAMDILEQLAGSPDGAALGEISNRLELHKSTVHRILGTLKERGYAVQDEGSGLYRLGRHIVALAGTYLNDLELRAEAEPFLRRLSERLGETVFLATLIDDEVVYLDNVESYVGLKRFSMVGHRLPVHCTSLGKALLFDLDDGEVRAILSRRPMVRRTPATLCEPDAYLGNLAACRKRGWSSDEEENEAGVSCVGAPIRDYRGRVAAALSAAWDTPKGADERDRIGLLVAETAAEISSRLGYRARPGRPASA